MTSESRAWKWAAHTVLLAFSVMSILPLLILFSSSVSDNLSIIQHGYSLLPRNFNLAAYKYLWSQSLSIFNAFGITFFVTIVGTIAGLLITSLLAYPLSRKDLPARKMITFFVVFTMFFNGGLVPTYMVYARLFNLRDSLLALIIPGLLMNGFHVIIMRTFFVKNISDSIIESACIDGASEFRIYYHIILPLSLPVMATIGLIQAIAYWNDWYNALVFITRPQLLGLQPVLNQMINNINFFATLNSQGVAVKMDVPATTVRMAVAFIGILPFLAAYTFFQKYFVRGLTVGSIKG